MKKPKRRKPKMKRTINPNLSFKPKLGKEFQLVVADVVREMDPNATVREGEWVVGPDGRRDLDVVVEGTVAGVVRRVQIECKDYSNEGRPIGIALIDALDSKHRDLKMDVSMMCSNGGFTDDAIRKAKRLGIGLVGVLRTKDPRIRYRVLDEIYIRRIELGQKGTIGFEWSGPKPTEGFASPEITYNGIPVANWLHSQVPLFLSCNPVVRGDHGLKYRFKAPIEVAFRSHSLMLISASIWFNITGGWIAQRVEIDATSGLYSWIRQAVRIGPGATTIEYKGIKFGVGGEPIRCPPGFEPSNREVPLEIGEQKMQLLDLGNYTAPVSVPDLNPLVMDDDLNPSCSDVPHDRFYSW